ncbi:Nramp family divalent metal transporter [Paramaledivibacter caminithermalis]|jgi:NRAMP (natural resistance-associated macrophage protein)-like metal ion transporter|uniref:NRAMP (Natural resistance-associated macrophage protein) metal ion transporters n=1 Tax=Paramaledivibacter caminithermalis (strain DSM 15212 / CIP 107654 / DViRD3) TaxID=1121301 RepID=A0A1M6LJV7_PARC5|nr:Nramp family divalent metal transporter [Paramaledivibacter caminithermalis]SHJ71452.1 NRAMP (natural resistance-associated macrophage protein) metal ion transporters [Paramaledivibacter caminithermalis DSM 15212]
MEKSIEKKKSFMERLKTMGPAAIVTAAFIGPGTVTTSSLAGAGYGYALLWAMVFSVFATIILQEMSARLGIVTRMGLGEALREQFENPVMKYVSIFLVISAIGIGCAAYETGNILGGALGLKAITGVSMNVWGPIMGIGAFTLLYTGSYKLIEKVLIGLVVLMSLVFITTAIVVSPDWGQIIAGMLIPSVPKGSVFIVMALIGTTVVPYNLFLHSSAVQERWKDASGLSESRSDILISIILGGLITLSIIITASAAFFGTGIGIKSAGDMAKQLEPLLGQWAKYFFAFGLFSAGLSSSITAPLAAAYATSGALGWKKDFKDSRFKAVWMIVLIIGIIFSAIGLKPISAIIFAQAANGILLPIVAIFLLYVMNNKKRLGKYVNSGITNLLGSIVVLVAIGLGLRSILKVLGLM